MLEEVLEGYRLSPQQRRLWLLQGESPAYWSHGLIRLEGALDRSALREAVARMSLRHEILRTGFQRLPGMDVPVQVIAPGAALELEEIDLRGSGPERQPLELMELLKAQAPIGLDAGQARLGRIALVSLGESRHALLVTISALWGDATGLENLVAELAETYGRVCRGEEDEPAALQYVQFSEWRNSVLEEEGAEGQAFWARQAGMEGGGLGLARARVGEIVPERLGLSLFPGWLEGVRELSVEAGCAPWVVVLAAWQTWLWRVSGERGERDVTVGYVADGRKFEELAGALGLFAQSLPVRTRLEESRRFRSLLGPLEAAVSEVCAWQEYFTLEDLERLSGGRRGFAALFEHRERRGDLEVEGLRFALREERCWAERFELRLSVLFGGEEPRLELHYDAGLYSPELARVLACSFESLLEAALRSPDLRIGELELLSGEERQRVLSSWNETRRRREGSQLVHELFSEQAAQRGEFAAVVSGAESLSYRELERRSNQLAHWLVGQGVGLESRVGVCLQRSVRQGVAVLGVLKAGGAYVPLDPSQPAERQGRMLADAGAELVIVEASTAGAVEGLAVRRVCLDEDASALAAVSDEALAVEVSPGQLAYVLYTSGSTGRPKGVMVEHRSVVNLAWSLREGVYGESAAGLRVGINAPLWFDGSVKQWVQLLHGHTVHVVPEEVRIDGEGLLRLAESSQLDVLDITPAQLRLLLQAGTRERLEGALGLVLVGGEAIDADLWERLGELSGVRFVNVYGPTECTVDATAQVVVAGEIPAIGSPLGNVRVYVVDERGLPVPVGVSGELWIGGRGVSRGYVGRPELTAERFVPDPFGGEPGGRLYRTGDRARWTESGRVESLGRVDHQIKLRGVRIEPGEIEAVLGEHPGVGEAVVVARADAERGDLRLVAYAVPRRGSSSGIPGGYRLPNGLRIAQQNPNETGYLYEEIFAKRSYVQHGIGLPPEACVVDVGANIGMFTLFVKRHCPGARVYAFEPIAPIFETLRANASLCGSGVKLFAHGLSSSEGTAQFTYYPRYSMMSSLAGYAHPEDEVEVVKTFLRNEQQRGSATAGALAEAADELLAGRFEGQLCESRLRRLGDVLREEGIGHIDLLKVDVQRAELDVLQGLEPADWSRIDQIVMEVHDAAGQESEGRVEVLRSLLSGHGFSVVVEQDELLEGTDRYNLYAVRQGVSHPPVPQSEVVEEGAELSPVELRGFLKERLPEAMVPSAVVLLDRLPLTRNGKVDRAALPTPEQVAGQGGREVIAPRTPFEEVLGEIWADLLGVEPIGVHDDFFDLGGHSLLATQLVARVREAFRVELPLRSLFDFPRIQELARCVEDLLRTDAGVQAPPIERLPRDGRPLPLSFAQQRLWFLHQLDPDSPAYNSRIALSLEGGLNVEALQGAIEEIVRRHEVLRTTFTVVGGEPAQIVAPQSRLPLPVVDLSSMPEESWGEVIRELAVREVQRPFDLARGPLFRLCLLRRSPSQHALLLTLHHIVSDAWSMGILAHELTALYGQLAGGPGAALPELPVQYADFASWQQAWLRGDVLERQLDYWRRHLAGAPAVLQLPTDRARPPLVTSHGARRGFALPRYLSDRLRDLGRKEGATIFMTLLTAYEVLLGRASGQMDLTVGMPIAGRGRLEVEPLIGFFINTLVVRGDLSGAPDFRTLLARVREASLGAFAHQDLPFEKLVDELQPERNMSHTPLFQAVFNFQVAGGEPLSLPDLEVRSVGSELPTAKFDLNLLMWDVEGALGGTLEYNTDLFDGTTMQRMLGSFERLLEAVTADPDRQVEAIDLLSPAERQQIVREWNDTAAGFARGRRIESLFEERAAGQPDAPAVVFGEQVWSYGELDRRANRLAHHLGSLGAGAGSLVGVHLGRSARMVEAVLGILKSGGAYVPLSTGLPVARLAWILDRLGIRHLVTEAERLEPLAALAEGLGPVEHLVCLDEAAPESSCAGRRVWSAADLAGCAQESPRRQAGSEALAYVIFTSGSTGTPKGVMVRHEPVINLIEWANARFGLGPQDRVLFLTSLGFDLSVYDVFGLLAAGGVVQVASEEDLAEPSRLVRLLCEEPVSFWDSAPAALQQLVPLLPQQALESARLRLVFLSGDWIPVSLPDRVRSVFPHAQVVSLGGATEATVWSNVHAIGEVPPHWASIPYGRPIPNARYHVLDSAGLPCPIGVAGDLYIGGDCLASGYAGEPELTAGKFVPDNLGESSGGVLYRTGDRARYWVDGTLEFLGRLDQQVKIRGFRIELGEIETVLGEHPEVRVAAALVREDVPGQKQLVAYVVAQQVPGPSAGELRSYLQSRLPEYMVPSAFVELASLPVTANGKLDRKALLAIRPEALEEVVAPRTPLEEILAGLYADLLGRERVGAEEDFFVLGGHSLLATQLISRLRELFGVEISLRSVFEAPTVNGLAAVVERALRTGLRTAMPPLVRVERDGPLPLSFAQERLWFLDQLEPGGAAYNIPTAVRVRGPLDIVALAASLSRVARRHEVLRTRFVAPSGEPAQVIDKVPAAALAVMDLTGLAEEARETEVRRLARHEALRPFDLAAGPLLRASLILLGARDHALLLTLHHIVSDGWSMGLLLSELLTAYASVLRGESTALPDLPVQYADYAVWQRGWLSGEVLEEQLDFWRERLTGAPPILELPTDRLRPAVWSSRGARISRTLPAGLAQEMRSLGRRQGTTLFMTVLAAWQALLSRLAGSQDVSVGAPVAGRTRVETERLIGLFINTLVLRTELEPREGFAHLLGQVRAGVVEAHAHQDLPFEKLVEELEPERSLSHSPLFQVMLLVQEPVRESGERAVADLEITPLEASADLVKVDLTLYVEESHAGLRTVLQYATDLFDAATADLFLGYFESLLTGAVEAPLTALEELPLLSGAERDQLLGEWNDTAAAYPETLLIHELFLAQAERAPQAVALVHGEERLTYGELRGQAESVARRLAALGVGPEVPVGVFFERSPSMIAAVLGVLLAGGAYLPLDPSYPAERLTYMLDDSRAPVVLTQRTLAPRLTGYVGQVVRIEDVEVAGAAEAGRAQRQVWPESPAYLIYTSGSTGRPKGVLVPHRGVVNFLTSMAVRPGLTALDVLVAVTTLSFDIAALELYLPLMQGARIVLAETETAMDGAALGRLLVASGATVLQATPATWRLLLAAGWGGEPSLKALCGGEALPRDLADELLARCSELWNLYGPTETTIWSAVHRVQPGGSNPVLLGNPIANTRIDLLDGSWKAVPLGIAGELVIGGDGLARGYAGRPDLTAERFIPDALSGEPGARVYRTGDLVRRRPDGNLSFLGRIDHQVKVRGYRIELGEVETLLREQPGVADAAAVVTGPGGDTLVAGFVTNGDEAPAAGLLREALRSRLPEHMVPSALFALDSLPRTPNGKVDRRALARIAAERRGESGVELEHVPPATQTEEILVAIWCEVLERERVGTRESFFALGGHSLLAARVMARARAAFGVELPLRDLFDAPTVAGLAQRVEAAVRAGASSTPSVPLPRQHPLSGLPAGGGTPAYSPLVAIRGGDVGTPPFFCVHPIGGSALCYLEMAECLPTGRPVYGLQARGQNQGEVPVETIEEMAALYLEAVRSVQPAGPYLVGGWSIGGLIAFEMVRQLHEAGEEVGLLALFDTRPPELATDGTLRPSLPELDEELDEGEPRVLASMVGYSILITPEELGPLDTEQRLALLLERAREENLAPSDIGLPEVRRYFELNRAGRRAARLYQPVPVPVRATLFLATEGRSVADPEAWGELATLGVDFVYVPGDHSTLMSRPHVEDLAVKLAEAMGHPAAHTEALPLVPVPRQHPLPLSFAQERIWFLDQLQPGGFLYNMPLFMRAEGALHVPALTASLGEVVRRHEVLRTRFEAPDGTPLQIVDPLARLEIPVIDLSSLPAEPQEEEARHLALTEARRGFDLARGSLLRVSLLRLAAENHAVLINQHHIVSDAESAELLIREIAVLYPAALAGRPSPLRELPVQYADFAVWQRRRLEGAVQEEQIGYWRERLAGAPPLLELPTDRPRPAVVTYRGRGEGLALPEGLSRELRTLSQRESVTPFMTLLAAFQALLGRISGQDDICVGVPVSGRHRLETEGMIGLFLNTLVLRVGLGARPGFRSLLRQVREATLGAFANQDVPFEKLVEEIRVERNLGHSPLFQVMFVMQPPIAETAEESPSSLRLQPMRSEIGTVKFDLTLALRDTPGGLVGALEYNSDLFDASTVRRFANHFERLLSVAMEDPETALEDLPLLSAVDRGQLLWEWNDTAADFPDAMLIHDLFLAQAGRTPEAVALVCGEERLTYSELRRQSEALARRLAAAGTGPEVPVGVFVERSPAMVVAVLGVLAAGGAYLPLDPSYPEERLAYMLDDSRAPVVLTQRPLAARLGGYGGRVVQVDDPGQPAEAAAEWVPLRAWPESPAYLIYTSGSTGRPKGVLVPHRGVASFLASMAMRPGLTAADRLVAVTTLSFDIAVLELFLPLMRGATVVLAEQDTAMDGAALRRLLVESGATALQATPATWRSLLAAGWNGEPGLKALCGGEALPRDLADELLARCPEVWNLYGPTETTIWSAVHRVEGEEPNPVRLGRPIANTRIDLLGRSLAAVPVGIPGELVIGGHGVTRGYAGQPALTAERFIPDPLSGQAGARVYRTGDLARRRPDGTLDFLGRIDHQVKVRGYRIELGEVEALLREQTGVADAAAAVVGGGLTACFVASGDEIPAAGTLREALRARLPEYMVPSVLVALDALPRTPNGKVDRRALARIAAEAHGESGAEHVPPATPTEQLLAGLWEHLLGRQPVGLRDNFFALGGYSLLGTQMMARLRQMLDVELPLRALFDAPTLAGLARRVEEAQREARGASRPPLRPVPRSGPLPLSFAQEQLWFVNRMEPDSPAYLIPQPLRLRGPLHPPLLEAALTEAVRRHEPLRTTFATDGDGAPVQVIQPPRPFPLPAVDLTGLPEGWRESEARRLSAEDARRPFSLASGATLFRATLLRLGESDHVALITLHHIVYDALSMQILAHDVAALYGALAQGRPSPLAPLPVQYADFAVWQRSWLEGETLQGLLEHWRTALAGAPDFLALPTDRPRPAVRSGRGSSLTWSLSAEQTEGLGKLARLQGVTPFMALLALYHILLARWADQDRVNVGLSVSGRPAAELEEVIGLFVNTLVFSGDLAEVSTFQELLGRTRDQVLDAHLHQDLPFERLIQELRPERSLGHTPLVQATFVYQHAAPADAPAAAGLEVAPLAVQSGTSKFDLTLAALAGGRRLAGSLSFNTDLWDAATLGRFLGHFRTLLEAAVADQGAVLADMPLLDESERHQLLRESSGGEAAAMEATLHGELEARVAAAPEAVALVFAGQRVSYGELDIRANRLARFLRLRGLGPEERVGICCERSVEMVVALLAVLKAGGAFAPLDPGSPPLRLLGILERLRPRLILTQDHLRDCLPPSTEVICLDRDAALWAGERADAVGVPVDPASLAFIVHTSGSTGRPKGVQTPHRSATSKLAHLVRRYGLGPQDVALQIASFVWDAAVRDIMGPLSAGARLVLLAPGQQRNPQALLEAIRTEGVTCLLSIVPSQLAALLDAAERQPPCPSVRLVLTSGESLRTADCRRARAVFPNALLVNQFGPTEATMVSTAHPVRDLPADREIVPVGRPYPTDRVFLLDRHLRPVPIGVPGGIYLGGDTLTRGYLGDPEQTAERFLPDAWSGEPGARVYWTGDQGRLRPDGTLEFLGRIDAQVKLRGIRVEPDEVAALLGEHPALQSAVVIARRDPSGDPRLVAYAVPQDGGPAPQEAELRSFLRERVPDYLIPADFVFLPALPLLPNGKVDRDALPVPGNAGGAMDSDLALPRDLVELSLVRLWEELLERSPIGLREDFFDLGGHSLLGLRLMAEIQERFGVEVPIDSLFQASTVEALADVVRASGGTPAYSPLVAIRAGEGGTPFFCIHPVGGGALCYVDLARCLPVDVPFYGLQARGQGRGEETVETIEEMATLYVEAVRSVQPAGPYLLGGWSFGGQIAFEMARRLHEIGEKVGLLALFDTRPPVAAEDWTEAPDLGEELAAEEAELIVGLLGRTLPLSVEELRPLDTDRRLTLVIERAREAQLLPPGFGLPEARRYLEINRANRRAARLYQPAPLPVQAKLFLAEQGSNVADPEAWCELATAGVEIIPVPGNHASLMSRPFVEDIAEKLADVLRHAALSDDIEISSGRLLAVGEGRSYQEIQGEPVR